MNRVNTAEVSLFLKSHCIRNARSGSRILTLASGILLLISTISCGGGLDLTPSDMDTGHVMWEVKENPSKPEEVSCLEFYADVPDNKSYREFVLASWADPSEMNTTPGGCERMRKKADSACRIRLSLDNSEVTEETIERDNELGFYEGLPDTSVDLAVVLYSKGPESSRMSQKLCEESADSFREFLLRSAGLPGSKEASFEFEYVSAD